MARLSRSVRSMQCQCALSSGFDRPLLHVFLSLSSHKSVYMDLSVWVCQIPSSVE